MAKYRNREVTVLQELPNPGNDMVEIEHRDLITGKEIVPRGDVTVSDEEMETIRKERDRHMTDENDFRIEGKTDQGPIPAPTLRDVAVERQNKAKK